MITVARIDERLIHGQVGYSWTVAYKSDAVMVVDNEVSKDEFQVSLLKMACPASLKCFVVDEDRPAACQVSKEEVLHCGWTSSRLSQHGR